MRKLTFEEITALRLTPEQMKDVERFPLYTLLDNIRSLYNVGSIFRTADAARLKKLFLCGITGHPPRREIEKTALGAVETVPWEYEKEALPLIRRLKEQGVHIVALEHTSESKPFNRVKYHFPACLIAGNEVFGVQEELVSEADISVEIPMFGSKQSLNVTIAFGILIYEMLFQYLEGRDSG